MSWLHTQFVVSLIAASGGIVVFIGLWIEHKADKEAFRSIEEFRGSKLRKVWGWRILMLGILMEVGVGAFLTVKEGRELKQLNAAIEQRKPENQPITTVSANVTLLVATANTNFWRSLLEPGIPFNPFVYLAFGKTPLTEGNIWNVRLLCTAFEEARAADSTELIMEFKQDPMQVAYGFITTNSVRTIAEWDTAVLDAPFLRNGTKVVRGRVALLINSAVVKTFEIPPQNAQFPANGYPEPMKVPSGSNIAVRVISSY